MLTYVRKARTPHAKSIPNEVPALQQARPEHADLFGVRWTEQTALAMDDANNGRPIPADEAEVTYTEYGPTGFGPGGPTWSKEPHVHLKDPNRIYQAMPEAEK